MEAGLRGRRRQIWAHHVTATGFGWVIAEAVLSQLKKGIVEDICVCLPTISLSLLQVKAPFPWGKGPSPLSTEFCWGCHQAPGAGDQAWPIVSHPPHLGGWPKL